MWSEEAKINSKLIPYFDKAPDNLGFAKEIKNLFKTSNVPINLKKQEEIK